jgi:prepilin-type N-terminal cleavage/methylation domain-containing protein
VDRGKGFTLIELMVVILTVGILAAVAIPIMRGRIDSARWAEGKAGAGTIATALRAYVAEKGAAGNYGPGEPPLSELGFIAGDLRGTYFVINSYEIVNTSYTPGADPELRFTIKVEAPAGIDSPEEITLDESGNWTERP